MTAPSRQPPSQELIERYASYVQSNSAGGNLHLVSDNQNIEDSHLKACIDMAGFSDDKEACWIATEMMSLSKSQRFKLVRGQYGKIRGGATRHECFLG